MVSTYFWQRRHDDGKVRSVVGIHMVPDFADRWIRSVDEMRDPSLDEIARLLGLQPEALTRVAGEGDQSIELSANIARCSVSGFETSIDFYKIPTVALVALKQEGTAPEVQPQVRVDIRTSLFIGLINSLQGLRSRFPKSAVVPDE
jgi:hypothetical protein